MLYPPLDTNPLEPYTYTLFDITAADIFYVDEMLNMYVLF